MIQDQSKELTFIVYNSPNPPRYIKIKKGLIRSLLFVLPTFIIFFLSASFVYSLILKNRVSELKSLELNIMKKMEELKIGYESEINTLKSSNAELTEKLSRGSSTQTVTTPLELFISPLGLKDLRAQELITIENPIVEVKGDRIHLKFNLSNNTQNNTKLTGYMTVVQYQGNTLQFFPSQELNEKNLKIEFAKGEYYSFSRLRISEANFEKTNSVSSRYKIYLFSKTGDLVLYKQIGPFNVE